MNANELRNGYLNFFEKKGHNVIPSASLVPENDPTVLFTTAGMQQFKRFYSNPEEADYSRATTCQKCIRTGDIDEVGDNTHLSFFEMLGNFSFGYADKEHSYFKKEAIEYAWEFLTEILRFDKKRIHATYFSGENGIDEDTESLNILKQIDGLNEIKPQGFDDNFWSLSSEGSPGGPTVEFYVDGIEVWNLVFNEYVMQDGKYQFAEFKGVDTGMGLERLLTVINDKENVYQTDLFESIIKKIEEISGKKYEDFEKEFRVIADHIKAVTFAISDGVLPSNKGAGYIVRRLIRRAIVKAQELRITNNFISNLAEIIFDIYKDVYTFDQSKITEELSKEETKFRATLSRGLSEFEKIKNEINGEKAFDLYQTYGFPWEMTAELAEENGIKVDRDQFEQAFKKHQDLSRTASAGMFKGGLADASEETTKLHTAAHLLLAALRRVVGDYVTQKGSNITAERLRFDFSQPEKLTPEQIKQVESLVNEQIQKDLPVTMEEMTLDEAKAAEAMGVFESKYGDKVKVYTIGPSATDYFSKEICGGPHVERIGTLGHIKIKKEESSSSGVRRIKAVLE